MKELFLQKPNIKEINKIVQKIVNRFNPEKVILFGSCAYKKPSEFSDIDILVVMNTRKRTIRQSAEISGSINHIFPVDIIVKRPEEIEWRLKDGDSFIKEIFEKGKILYEKNNIRMDKKAEKDYLVVKNEINSDKPVYDAICFHAQQCIEKYLKALINEYGLVIPKIHDLDTLLNICKPVALELEIYKKEINDLSTFSIAFRYPGEDASKGDSEYSVNIMYRLRRIIRKIIRKMNN